jgi:hypothetical protein
MYFKILKRRIEKIIKFNNDYKFFFLEDKSIKFKHPVDNYYLQIYDLSVNLLISLKWIEWGYFFLSTISTELKSNKDQYIWSLIIPKSINKNISIKESNHILTIDDNKVESKKNFEDLL